MSVVGVNYASADGAMRNLEIVKESIGEAIDNLEKSQSIISSYTDENTKDTTSDTRLSYNYNLIQSAKTKLNNDLEEIDTFKKDFENYMNAVEDADRICSNSIKSNAKEYNKNHDISVIDQIINLAIVGFDNFKDELGEILNNTVKEIIDIGKKLKEFYDENQWLRGIVKVGFSVIGIAAVVKVGLALAATAVGTSAVVAIKGINIFFLLEDLISGAITTITGLNGENGTDMDLATTVIENYYNNEYTVGSDEYNAKVEKAKSNFDTIEIFSNIILFGTCFAKGSWEAFKKINNGKSYFDTAWESFVKNDPVEMYLLLLENSKIKKDIPEIRKSLLEMYKGIIKLGSINYELESSE